MNMDWKESFDSASLNTGLNMARTGMVRNFRRNGNMYQADVIDPWSGKSNRVSCRIDDGNVELIDCACPYSRSGGLCEHEAAFLYALESLGSPENIPDSGQNPQLQKTSRYSEPKTRPDSVRSEKPESRPEALKKKSEEAASQEENDGPISPEEMLWRLLSGEDISDVHKIKRAEHPEKTEQPKERSRKFQGRSASGSNEPRLNERAERAEKEEKSAQKADSSYRTKPQADSERYPHSEPENKEAIHPASDFFREYPYRTDASSQRPDILKKKETKQSPVDSRLENKNPEARDIKPASKVRPDFYEQTESQKKPQNGEESRLKPEESKPEAEPVTAVKPKTGITGGIAGLIDSLEAKTLREFVLQEARENLDFRQKLEVKMLHEIPEDLLDTYFSGLDTLMALYQNDFGSIPEAKAEEFAENVTIWLGRRIRLLLDEKQPSAAFELLKYAADSMLSISYLLPEPQEEKIWDVFIRLLEETADESEGNLRKDIFLWLEGCLEKAQASPAAADELEEFWLEEFDEPEYVLRKASRIEKRLSDLEKEYGKAALSSEEAAEWIEREADILSEHPQFEKQYQDFLQKYPGSLSLLKRQIDQSVKREAFSQASSLIEKALEYENEDSEMYASFMRQLIAIEEGRERKVSAAALLKKLILNNPYVLAEDLLKFRDLSDEAEWKEVLEFAEQNRNPFEMAEVYAKTGDLSRLMNLLEKHPLAYFIEKYEENLEQTYPARMAALWIAQAKNQAASSSRAGYDHVISSLKHAAAYPSVQSDVQKAVDEIKSAHPKKRSLLRRLQEAGF